MHASQLELLLQLAVAQKDKYLLGVPACQSVQERPRAHPEATERP